MKALDQYRLQGVDTSFLEEQDREYLEAWDQLSEEQRAEMARHGIYGPKLEHHGRVDRTQKAPDIDYIYQKRGMIQQPEDQEAELEKGNRAVVASALAQMLYAITDTRHELCDLIAQLTTPAFFMDPRDCQIELATQAAVLGRTPERSLAAVAKLFSVERATIQKRGRELRAKEIIKRIQSYMHGGKLKDSLAAKENATKDHEKKRQVRNDGKPSPFAKILWTKTQS